MKLQQHIYIKQRKQLPEEKLRKIIHPHVTFENLITKTTSSSIATTSANAGL